ncbi:MAG TPA: TMEM175 family protein [Acidimicrobiales bacterium]
MDSARLEAFSDGVFAVAITLLALDLTVAGPGHGTLAHQLSDKWPSFAAYFISFLTIGIIWVNHHTIFKNLSEIDRTLLFLNLLLLFFVVSIPFATSTMARYLQEGGTDSHLAAALYMAAFEGMSIAFALIFSWSIRHEHMKVPLEPADARRARIRFGMGHIGYITGIGLAFVSAYAALVISFVVAAYYVFEQTPRRAADEPSTE